MGLWSTIKRWFNIGGPKVYLADYNAVISRADPVVAGSAVIRSKSDRTVLGVEVKVIEEYTTTDGEGDKKRTRTRTTVLGVVTFPERDPGIGYPLEIKAGQQVGQAFTVEVALPNRLENAEGVLGHIARAAAWVSDDRLAYYLVAEARVKGAAFDTTDKQRLTVGA